MQGSLKALTDEQLCADCGQSSQAMEELVGRYQKLVRACARPYFLVGAEFDDLLQEGMLGLLHAVSLYDPQREVSFQTFAAVCIRNRLISAVRRAGSDKHRLLNDSVPLCTFSLDAPSDEVNLSPTEKSPEELLIGREEYAEFQTQVASALSPLENRVLELYLEGLSYQEIASILNRSAKSVDNAVQRIRKKIARQTIPSVNGKEAVRKYSDPV